MFNKFAHKHTKKCLERITWKKMFWNFANKWKMKWLHTISIDCVYGNLYLYTEFSVFAHIHKCILYKFEYIYKHEY